MFPQTVVQPRAAAPMATRLAKVKDWHSRRPVRKMRHRSGVGEMM